MVEMLGRMSIFRIVAAPDMAARKTQPKMDPIVTAFKTLLASFGRLGFDVLNRRNMIAFLAHAASCHELLQCLFLR